MKLSKNFKHVCFSYCLNSAAHVVKRKTTVMRHDVFVSLSVFGECQ